MSAEESQGDRVSEFLWGGGASPNTHTMGGVVGGGGGIPGGRGMEREKAEGDGVPSTVQPLIVLGRGGKEEANER